MNAVISGMFTTAVRWEWLASSPAERARLPRMRARTVTAPEPEEVEQLLAAAARYSFEFGVFLRVAVATGARRGELCGIQWRDIDVEHGEVRIERAVAASDLDRRELVTTDPKSHQGRLIALDSGTLALLRRLRTAMRERALAVGALHGDEAFVFSDAPAGARAWHSDRNQPRGRRAPQLTIGR
jgi:integrase